MAKTLYCARCLTTFLEDVDACTNMTCGRQRPKAGWGVLLQPGDILDRHYEITRALAIGGAGLTYLARELDENGSAQEPDLAIKVLYTARAKGPFLRRLANEAQILQELAHENIVEVRGFVQRTGKEPYLVTLFEHGGALTDHIEAVGGVGPRPAAGMLRQILLALDVAHQRGVVHRDLKPDNVLLHERVKAEEIPVCKLTDFGIAKIEGGMSKLTRVGAFVGTPEYAAPEQFLSQPPSPATDVFAAGGVLFYLMTGQAPVSFSHRGDIQHSYEELLTQLPPQLPTEGHDPVQIEVLQEVVNNIMTVNPDHRWTVHQVLARLNALLDGTARPLRPGTLELTDKGAPSRQAVPAFESDHGPGAQLGAQSQPTQTPGGPDTVQTTIAGNAPSTGPVQIVHTTGTNVLPGAPGTTTIVVQQKGGGGSWLGLGLMGMLMLGLGGTILIIGILGGAAYALGYFEAGGAMATTQPVVITGLGKGAKSGSKTKHKGKTGSKTKHKGKGAKGKGAKGKGAKGGGSKSKGKKAP